MLDKDDILSKFEPYIIEQLDEDNLNKIIDFLIFEKVKYIEDILNNYIDIFIIDYNEFVKKFNKLKVKYGNNLSYMINENMDILEKLL